MLVRKKRIKRHLDIHMRRANTFRAMERSPVSIVDVVYFVELCAG